MTETLNLRLRHGVALKSHMESVPTQCCFKVVRCEYVTLHQRLVTSSHNRGFKVFHCKTQDAPLTGGCRRKLIHRAKGPQTVEQKQIYAVVLGGQDARRREGGP